MTRREASGELVGGSAWADCATCIPRCSDQHASTGYSLRKIGEYEAIRLRTRITSEGFDSEYCVDVAV